MNMLDAKTNFYYISLLMMFLLHTGCVDFAMTPRAELDANGTLLLDDMHFKVDDLQRDCLEIAKRCKFHSEIDLYVSSKCLAGDFGVVCKALIVAGFFPVTLRVGNRQVCAHVLYGLPDEYGQKITNATYIICNGCAIYIGQHNWTEEKYSNINASFRNGTLFKTVRNATNLTNLSMDEGVINEYPLLFFGADESMDTIWQSIVSLYSEDVKTVYLAVLPDFAV